MHKVSIHAPVMGAKDCVLIVFVMDIVSIHAPVMGAKLLAVSVRPRAKFQSTHP